MNNVAKKLLSLILVAVLVSALGVTAFAAGPNVTSGNGDCLRDRTPYVNHDQDPDRDRLRDRDCLVDTVSVSATTAVQDCPCGCPNCDCVCKCTGDCICTGDCKCDCDCTCCNGEMIQTREQNTIKVSKSKLVQAVAEFKALETKGAQPQDLEQARLRLEEMHQLMQNEMEQIRSQLKGPDSSEMNFKFMICLLFRLRFLEAESAMLGQLVD